MPSSDLTPTLKRALEFEQQGAAMGLRPETIAALVVADRLSRSLQDLKSAVVSALELVVAKLDRL